ncbi:hypothetical protein B9T31_06300 [Acinetobacter sp. ANC 4558]|uniref:XAC2610-related protein n=1 Tax=Acinetobacter sp. ANC 4558 TaxID=1977876 RepID=UPI000A3335F4|nr:hypothetical protein [Acinetobacter sp. ANC 4558]OTG86612.1 hypothetical protein B9T31_06300 [Acinetobacter sp. ANC 4558]
MNFYKKLALMSIGYFSLNLSYADNLNNESIKSLMVINNVDVQVSRALKTPSGAYLLQMGSGYWKPNATLYDISQNKMTYLEGVQKGNNIQFVSSENNGIVKNNINLDGSLDVETGIYRSILNDRLEGFKQELVFLPLINIKNRPTFLFKFYGTENKETGEKIIQKVEVIDRKTKQIYQQLTGFSAYATGIQYIDLNFDGYFDLILKDTSSALGDGEHSIYWMYNPETKKFQRSPQLEVLGGSPVIDIEKKQVDFGNGHKFEIKDGQFYKIKN